MDKEQKLKKREKELRKEIEAGKKRGWADGWGDAKTWMWIIPLIFWATVLALICWQLIGDSVMTEFNLGHPATQPG